MAANPHTAAASRNAMADVIGNAADTGFLRIYDGAQPANADTALTGQVLLAELLFGADAFAPAAAGVATANAVTADASANATGTASWFRCLKSDGTTALFDGSVGASGADLNLNTTAIQVGAQVAVTALTYTVPA